MKRYSKYGEAQMIESAPGAWVRYENAQAIIDDLQARLDRWNHGGNYIGTNAAIKERDAEIEQLRQQVADRGERMKEMRDILESSGNPRLVWLLADNKPFDPETGEPL